LNGEIELFATSDSGLSVSYSSDNTSVVDVSGNKLIMKGSGTASITASQAGNDAYNAAIPVSQTQVVNRTVTFTTTLPLYNRPFQITATTSNPSAVTITINITNAEFTASTGVAYVLNTGLRGVVCKFSIVAQDGNENPVTNFATSPVTLNLQLPNATPSNTLNMYKLEPGTFRLMNPQPANYPVTLTYTGAGNAWTCEIPSLSEFVVQDETPPAGLSGGDPHIRPILSSKRVTTLPNKWKLVKLYESSNYLVTAQTEFINADIVSKMHEMNGEKINVTKHKYVVDYTYFVNVKIYKDNEECLNINMVNGEIEHDNKKIILDKNNSGRLYSLLHEKYYQNMNARSYIVYLNNSNRLELTVDNHWVDLNSFGLYINDPRTIKTCKGELIYHDADNCLLEAASINVIGGLALGPGHDGQATP
jgi:hypothetical protein